MTTIANKAGSVSNRRPMTNKCPCIHGNLCKEYWNKFHVIYSTHCPDCDRYEPKLQKVREYDESVD